MTCRHEDPINNPACSSYRNAYQQVDDLERKKAEVQRRFGLPDTPDANNFQIEDIEEVGDILIVKALYPNCDKCSYEGMKVMVFRGVTIKDAIKWRKIDPHFGEPGKPKSKTEAPSPIARFPASAEGWQDAVEYARSKSKSTVLRK